MNRRKKIFERVVNPLISKHMIDPFTYKGSCIASGIPIKYLSYFKDEKYQSRNSLDLIPILKLSEEE